MCKAKDEGPRCSYGGRVRITRAEKYENRINAKAEREMATKGKLSARTEAQMRNVLRRNVAAKNVYYATPEGWRNLEADKDVMEQKLSNMPEGTVKEKSAKNGVSRKIAMLRNSIEKGQARRKAQTAARYFNRADRGAVSEKKELRDKARAQGANINERAQKAYQPEIDAAMNADKDYAVSLQSWDRSDVEKQVPHWVKERSGWQANDNTRPPKGGEGEVVVPSKSNLISMVTPDGSYAEARYDVHVRKNDKGKFVVSQRYIAASDWRDAGIIDEPPADTPQQHVGHLLATKKGRVSRRDKVEVKEFKSKAEAVKFSEKAQRRISQASATNLAMDSREALISRAAKSHGAEAIAKVGRHDGRHLYSGADMGEGLS